MREDIYTVSIALTAGVLTAFLSEKFLDLTGGFCYWVAAFSPLLLVPFLHFAQRSRHWALWLGVFFLIGLLLYALGSINAVWVSSGAYGGNGAYGDAGTHGVSGAHGVSGVLGRHLAGLQEGISLRIGAIPFKDPENNALMEALLLGRKGGLSASTVAAFRNAGAAHLLALSGMHLGIIYAFAGKALQLLLGNSILARRIRHVAIILLCLWYTMICGAGDSLLRAWLFILLRESGLLLDRPQPPGQILCAALTLHLVVRPLSVGNIGFQLSYLAMVGIVFVWPLVKDWLDSRIWSAASLSICCQLFTAPLTLLYFGTFPKYFLITNLLAAPLLSVVLVCCVLLLILGTFSTGSLFYLAVSICEYPLTLLRALLNAITMLG